MESKFSKIKNNKKIYIICLVIIALIFSLRILQLDKDLPPWGIINYQPIDEGSYSILALNKLIYGQINLSANNGLVEVVTPNHVRVNIIGNSVSYASMKLLGRNYYGYRLPSVIFALGIFIIIALSIKELSKYYNFDSIKSKWLILVTLLYVALDFTFLTASRVVEPSIVRAFLNACIIYFFIKLRKKEKERYFVLGFLATVSVFLVYVSNVFIFLPCGVVLLLTIWGKDKKKIFTTFLFFIAGCLIALGISELYYKLVWDTYSIKNMLEGVSSFTSVSGYSSSFNLKALFKNFVSFWSSNIFLYNPTFLALTLFALIFNAYYSFKKKDELGIFIIVGIIGFLCQSIYSNDYIVRKIITIYPFLILNILAMVFCFKYFMKDYIKMKEESSFKYLNQVVPITVFMVILFCVCAMLFRLVIIKNGVILDFKKVDKIVIAVLGLAPLIGMSICFINRLFLKDIKKNFNGNFIYGFVMVSFLLSVYMSSKYIYFSNSYTEKQVMIDIGKVVGGNYVLGEYEYGYTLYNDMKPVLNTYEKLSEFIENDGVSYYFDYYFEPKDEGGQLFLSEGVFGTSDYTVKPVAVFNREFKTFGKSRKVALYEKVKKTEKVPKIKTRGFIIEEEIVDENNYYN